MSKSVAKKCPGKEHFERMNYLLQISKEALNQNQPVAAQLYSNLVFNIAKKTVLKIDPKIKRELCRRCHQYLVPGINCKIRIKKKRIVTFCYLCKFKRSIKTGKDYKIWLERPESVIEILEYKDEAGEEDNETKL